MVKRGDVSFRMDIACHFRCLVLISFPAFPRDISTDLEKDDPAVWNADYLSGCNVDFLSSLRRKHRVEKERERREEKWRKAQKNQTVKTIQRLRSQMHTMSFMSTWGDAREMTRQSRPSVGQHMWAMQVWLEVIDDVWPAGFWSRTRWWDPPPPPPRFFSIRASGVTASTKGRWNFDKHCYWTDVFVRQTQIVCVFVFEILNYV